MKTRIIFNGVRDAVEMTAAEYAQIREERDTPDFVIVAETGELMYNEFTCCSSRRYGGNCNCISHPHKKWVNYGTLDGGEWRYATLKDEFGLDEVELKKIKKSLEQGYRVELIPCKEGIKVMRVDRKTL